MQGIAPPDPETEASEEYWALVYMPGRNRQRYPANCVQIVDSAKAARTGAQPAQRLFPAKVAGPSKSSQGQMLYYLVEWLSPE
jgi:hypothetical protein